MRPCSTLRALSINIHVNIVCTNNTTPCRNVPFTLRDNTCRHKNTSFQLIQKLAEYILSFEKLSILYAFFISRKHR